MPWADGHFQEPCLPLLRPTGDCHTLVVIGWRDFGFGVASLDCLLEGTYVLRGGAVSFHL